MTRPRAGRFTAWFDGIERIALETEAQQQNATINWVVRKAVRQYLGKEKLKEAAEQMVEKVS